MADEKSELEKLKSENAALKGQLQAQTQSIVAQQGPEVDTPVCYQRAGEGFCRPAKIVSDGFTEMLKAPGGAVARHALLEYREAPWTLGSGVPDHVKGHGFQTDRPWDSLGRPETWHMPDECPRQGGPGCPYAKNPEWPARHHVEAP